LCEEEKKGGTRWGCLSFVVKDMSQRAWHRVTRSRAVRPIGYFAVLQDAEQISVPAVHVSADILGKSWRGMCYRFLPLPKMSAWVPVR
jgi:hypothetical protein